MGKDDKKVVLRYMSLGAEFASSILGCTFLGIVIDKKLSTTPLFTIVGVFFGFAVGMYLLIAISKRINNNDDDEGVNR